MQGTPEFDFRVVASKASKDPFGYAHKDEYMFWDGTLLGTILPELHPLIHSYWIAKARGPFSFLPKFFHLTLFIGPGCIKKSYSWGSEFGDNGIEPGQFKSPYGMAMDRDQNLWVADSFNHRIQGKINPHPSEFHFF